MSESFSREGHCLVFQALPLSKLFALSPATCEWGREGLKFSGGGLVSLPLPCLPCPHWIKDNLKGEKCFYSNIQYPIDDNINFII